MSAAMDRARGLLCRLGMHRSDYSGNAYTHAPRPICCERCGRRLT